MNRRLLMASLRPAAVILLGALLWACVPAGQGVRGSRGVECRSDRDCGYGLTCRGSEDGGAMRCEWQTFGRCGEERRCLAGQTCREGVCTVECLDDVDCGDNRTCYVGACEAAKKAGQCLSGADCRVGEECVAGRCVDRIFARCLNDFDCPGSRRCIGGACR